MRRRTFIAASLGSIAGVAGVAIGSGRALYSGAALAFGTTIAVSVVHADRRQAEAAIAAALQAAQRVDRLMSIYHPASQVYQLNRDGCLASPDPQLLAVLEQAQQLSQLTGGAFDITVQPLWNAFSEAAGRASLPREAVRRRAQQRVDWRQLAVARDAVRLLRPGMAITLNGLAQGYAADQALAALRAHGIEHALLDTGEFIARGRKQNHAPWTLGVRDPRQAGELAATFQIDGASVATSGDYETTFSPDFAHHHIFDPALGDSPRELASVTVVAPQGMLADGLSTAFMVMGREKAAALAATLPGVDLMTIDKQGREWRSATFPAPV